MTKIPDIPELHELKDFTAALPDGGLVKAEYPDKQFPDVRPQRWRVDIYSRRRNSWPMVTARLEGVTGPDDLWNRIVNLHVALSGKETK